MKFEIIGKLNKAKDTDKFKSYDEMTFDSGFVLRTLRVNALADGSRFNLDIKGGIVGAEDKAKIYTMIKKDKGYENKEIKYKDRDKYISKVAEFKKFVFAPLEGDRFEFMTGYDFAQFMNTMLSSDAYEYSKFKIMGEVELSQYNDKNTGELKTGKRYVVSRIYEVDAETEESATAQVDLLIDENAISDTLLEDQEKLLIHGYVEQYNSKKKGNIGIQQVFEYSLVGKGDKKDTIVKKLRTIMTPQEEDTLSKIGFNLELVNKSESADFSIDMITDDEKDLLDMGFTTEEELKKEYSSGKGNTIERTIIKTIKKKYAGGCIDAAITLVDLLSKPEDKKSEKLNLEDLGKLDDEESDDLFA